MKVSSEKESKFVLSKWYMDCVTDNGEVFIAYWGILQWKGMSIYYASLLKYDDTEGTKIKTSLRKHLPPLAESSGVQWGSRSLGFEGKWISAFSPVERVLLASDEGAIQWQCMQPGASAHLVISPGKSVSGLGYTEQIRMTIKPWLLPIDELRWGRFVSETDSIVWIEWRGEKPQTLALRNGAQVGDASVSDERIVLHETGEVLHLKESRPLREGPLFSTTLHAIPGIKKIVPGRILDAHECKWRSRGTLEKAGSSRTGWAIHEVVTLGGGTIGKPRR